MIWSITFLIVVKAAPDGLNDNDFFAELQGIYS